MSEIDKKSKLTKPLLSEQDKENLQKVAEGLSLFANEIGKNIQRAVQAVDDFAKQNAPLIAEIIKSLSEIPSDFLAIQQALAERGWFVLAEMPLNDYRNLKRLIDDSNFDELDRVMCAWTSALLDTTEKELCVQFPNREAILREGIDNHRNGRYASAIALLLTQADGLCFDSLGKIFFKINRATGKPVASDEIDALGVDEFAKITLHPILIKSGINATDKQIADGEFSDSPHRHPILHGTAIDYPSELNSWKIISFVGFMGGVVNKVVTEARALTTTPSETSI